MTTPISSVTGTDTSAKATGALSSAAGGQKMDREAFLKLLVAQISHQDPLKPMEGTEFVTQLSQFAMVEQAIAQSTQLGNVSTQLGGIANNDATALVGKQITVRGKSLTSDGITATTSAVTLSGPAAKVSADILDANGKVVRTLDLGAHAAGALPITWDGKDAAGNPQPKGTYFLKVNATTADGKAVSSTQDVTGVVTKISFEKGYPELTLDNGATAPISDLVGVATAPITPASTKP
jgi:flagellar basal-body rod modification protein FlgD